MYKLLCIILLTGCGTSWQNKTAEQHREERLRLLAKAEGICSCHKGVQDVDYVPYEYGHDKAQVYCKDGTQFPAERVQYLCGKWL